MSDQEIVPNADQERIPVNENVTPTEEEENPLPPEIMRTIFRMTGEDKNMSLISKDSRALVQSDRLFPIDKLHKLLGNALETKESRKYTEQAHEKFLVDPTREDMEYYLTLRRPVWNFLRRVSNWYYNIPLRTLAVLYGGYYKLFPLDPKPFEEHIPPSRILKALYLYGEESGVERFVRWFESWNLDDPSAKPIGIALLLEIASETQISRITAKIPSESRSFTFTISLRGLGYSQRQSKAFQALLQHPCVRVDGPDSLKIVPDVSGVTGIQGPPGDYGDQGMRGAAGNVGVAGYTGAPWNVGQRGPPGTPAKDPNAEMHIPGLDPEQDKKPRMTRKAFTKKPLTTLCVLNPDAPSPVTDEVKHDFSVNISHEVVRLLLVRKLFPCIDKKFAIHSDEHGELVRFRSDYTLDDLLQQIGPDTKIPFGFGQSILTRLLDMGDMALLSRFSYCTASSLGIIQSPRFTQMPGIMSLFPVTGIVYHCVRHKIVLEKTLGAYPNFLFLNDWADVILRSDPYRSSHYNRNGVYKRSNCFDHTCTRTVMAFACIFAYTDQLKELRRVYSDKMDRKILIQAATLGGSAMCIQWLSSLV